MEPKQTLNFNEKYSSLINNRNLKDYSCFIGAKTNINGKKRRKKGI